MPKNAKEIFITAIEKYRPEQWSAFLDGACGVDEALRVQVEDLLSAHKKKDSFLDQKTASIAQDLGVEEGSSIGPFKLLQRIGEGGFGVVYMAEQTKPVRRKVALKIIKPGMDTKEVIARFQAERQALAMMDHPNIAKVLDAGATESGRPYFAMELVKGVTITDYADANHLSTRDRLTLFATICRAVQHAHQKGVIHRDLKPSNVMVTLHDGKPVPKVIDFGVSKAVSQPLTEKTLFTRYGQVIGTPQYMSPEQAEMSGLDVDTRSDVYSLGVILYELLTGRTPFLSDEIRQAGFDEMRRMIREREPLIPSNVLQTLDKDTATSVANNRSSRPEALQKLVRGELDWIVMRALEKDRNRRYMIQPVVLVDDVDRHLNNQPVEANPPSIAYKLWKSYQRNRWLFIASSSVAASLLICTIVSVVFAQAAARARDSARVAQLEAETQREEADKQRVRAEDFAVRVDEQSQSAKQSLDAVLTLLAKADVNPDSGKEFTVREALAKIDNGETQDLTISNIPSHLSMNISLALGRAYLATRHHGLAVQHLRKAVQRAESAQGTSSVEYGLCLQYLGCALKSEDELRRAISIHRELDNSRELAASLTLLGSLLASQGRDEEAVTIYHEAAERFVPHASVQLGEIPQMHLSRAYDRKEEDARSQKFEIMAIECAKQSKHYDRDAWLALGKSLHQQARDEESELALLVAHSMSTGKEVDDAANSLGELYLALGDFNKAETFASTSLRQAELRQDKDAIKFASNLLREVLFQGARYEKALLHFASAVNGKDSNPIWRDDVHSKGVGDLLVMGIEDQGVNNWLTIFRQEAEAKLQSRETSKSDAKHIAFSLAKIANFDADYDRGRSMLEIADRNYTPFFHVRSRLLARGHMDKAIQMQEYFARARQKFGDGQPQDRPWDRIALGNLFNHVGDTERAEENYRSAVKQCTVLLDQHEWIQYFAALNWAEHELAAFLLRADKQEEARVLFKQVAARFRTYADREQFMGGYFEQIANWNSQVQSGLSFDNEKLIHGLQRHLNSAKDDNSRGWVLQVIGGVYESQQDWQAAISAYEESSLLRPQEVSNDLAEHRLRYLYVKTEQLDRKVSICKVIKDRDKKLYKPTLKGPLLEFTWQNCCVRARG
ncbi:MAG: serine/threonine-protein kinase [Pirellulaceae bacterium]